MRHLLIILFLFVTTMGKAQIKVLPKNSSYEVKDKKMVVMDERTFASFYYYREHYDSLKILVKEYDSLVSSAERTNYAMKEYFSLLIKKKDEQIKTYHTSYDQTKFLLDKNMEEANTLRLEFLKLEKKHRRKQVWNNVFKASTAVLAVTTTVLILLAK